MTTQEQINKKILDLNEIRVLADQIPEYMNAELHVFDSKLLVCLRDYEKVGETLKVLRKITGEKFSEPCSWYSFRMLFQWEGKGVLVRYECEPENIPDELMPTGGCEVVKTMSSPEVTYSIVCSNE